MATSIQHARAGHAQYSVFTRGAKSQLETKKRYRGAIQSLSTLKGYTRLHSPTPSTAMTRTARPLPPSNWLLVLLVAAASYDVTYSVVPPRRRAPYISSSAFNPMRCQTYARSSALAASRLTSHATPSSSSNARRLLRTSRVFLSAKMQQPAAAKSAGSTSASACTAATSRRGRAVSRSCPEQQTRRGQ